MLDQAQLLRRNNDLLRKIASGTSQKPLTTFEVQSLTSLGQFYYVTSYFDSESCQVIYKNSSGTEVEEGVDFVSTNVVGVETFEQEFNALAGDAYVELEREIVNVLFVTLNGVFLFSDQYDILNNRVYFLEPLQSDSNVRVVYVGINNMVNQEHAITDDITLELAPVGGTDTLNGQNGVSYTVADLKQIIVDRGAVYMEDGTPFSLDHEILTVEAHLKAINGEGYGEGLIANYQVATSSDASYKNNGSWSNLDTGGARQDIKDGQLKTLVPTSFQEIFVANGSVVLLQVEFQKKI